MTTPVVTVTSRTPIRRAAALMKGRSIGSLVVTSANGKVAGIVTVSDLLDYVARKPRAPVEQASCAGPRQKREDSRGTE